MNIGFKCRSIRLNDGGRWRIRTPVSGSEGRKDIQTTLIARIHPERTPLLEEGGWRRMLMARSFDAYRVVLDEASLR